MEIIKIILIGIITCVAAVLLKQFKPELAILVTIAGSIVILIIIVNSLTTVVGYFTQVASKTNINLKLFSSIIKIVGIGYITEFGANVCNDSGNSSLADKILLGGKVVILCFALPIVNSMLSTIMGLFS